MQGRPWSERWFNQIGNIALVAWRGTVAVFERPFPWGQLFKQLHAVGVRSFSIIFLTGLFTGMVLALQGGVTLETFGAKSMVGHSVAATLIKELGPVLAALMIAGRVGAGFASELGTMVVTSQVSALQAMGINPYRWLIMPRIFAITIMLPLLTVYVNFIGLIGGWAVCVTTLDLSTLYYLRTISESITATRVFGAFVKSLVFGYLIGCVSSAVGMSARGGSEAVGYVTTKAVVLSSICVLISDFLLARFLYILLGS